MSNPKPYDLSKRRLLEAYRRVKANQGAVGIDGISLSMFEADGGVRILGVPTVSNQFRRLVGVSPAVYRKHHWHRMRPQ